MVVYGKTGPVAEWMIIALNFTLINTLLTLAIGGVLAAIDDARKRERASLSQLQLQIERLPLAYLISDADLRLTRWNPAAEQLFGFTESEVLGQRVSDIVIPSKTQLLSGTFTEELRAGNTSAHYELESRTGNNGPIIAEWHNTPMLDDKGGFAGLLSVVQDVSARKSLEQQLRQAQKMEAIGQLAGGVAHDFNNLLTVIFGYTSLLLADPLLDASSAKALHAISEAGERAASLTRQLLAFSRQSILEPKVLDANAVLRDTGKMLRRLIGEDIEFTMVFAPDVAHIRVDPGQLDQILMNLTVNARDAMPTGGKLTIETANVTLSDEYSERYPDSTPGRYVVIAVTDTGTGMSPDVLARIFEPFFTTKETGKGTGLGLAMVFGIVQQSGGRINVYSEPGIGTTFKIYLPAITESLSSTHDGRPEPDSGGTETILLVEDDSALRTMTVGVLRDRGYTVISALDGADAMIASGTHLGPIDLLLTDVVMPNTSGPELAAALLRLRPAIRVLYMSGYTDDAVVRHGLLHANVAFIQKPFMPAALGRKIRDVLDADPHIVPA
jgi:PAS domain S-box-containing protein